MTNSINRTYESALLADAAYLSFDEEDLYDKNTGVIKSDDNTFKAFQKRGFTQEQFDIFQNRYLVVDHVDSLTGFSATLFWDTEAQQLTLANRGTEERDLRDWLHDITLAAGLAETVGRVLQTGALTNFIEKDRSSVLGGENFNLFDADGNVLRKADGTVARTLNIVGHSLGGHLSLMAAYDYPELVNEVYTFNGAGLSLLDVAYNELKDTVWRALVEEPRIPAERIFNYYAEAGLEVTANNITFAREGTRIPLFIQSQGQTVEIGNHSIVHSVDSLSVMRILEQLAPDMGIVDITRLLMQAHNRQPEYIIHDEDNPVKNGLSDTDHPANAAVSLDLVMAHLATMLGGPYANLSITNKAEEFFQTLLSDVPHPLTLKPLSEYSDPVATATLDPSNAGIALRYALLTGASFVVIPPDGTLNPMGIFDPSQSANSLYQLDQFSEQFWTDRVDFYNRLMNRNETDLNEQSGVFGTISGISAGSGKNQYVDFFTQQQIEHGQSNIHLRGSDASEYSNATNDPMVIFGSAGNDQGGTYQLSGRNADDHIYGMAGDDRIEGNGGNDHLEGNSGMDTLIGGKGTDTLLGGADNDRYIYTLGDGFDTIRDTQGVNQLVLKREESDSGEAVTRVTRIGSVDSSVYEDADGNTFALTNDGRLLVLLKNDSTGGLIVIEDFDKNDPHRNFGIHFEEEEAEIPSPADGAFVVGDGHISEHGVVDSDYEDRPYETGQEAINGRVIVYDAPTATGIWEDLGALNGVYNEVPTAGSDEMPNIGVYRFEGGDLGDYLDGGDNIYLRPGSDGYAAVFNTLSQEARDKINGPLLAGIIGGIDYLDGKGGDDHINGNNGINYLLGGVGSDTIKGGADRDFLFGNSNIRLETVFYPGGYWEFTVPTDLYGYRSETGNGRDDIRGGGGDDAISGDEDNDLLLGESGNDGIAGGQGSDVILGGAGMDTIFADSRIEGRFIGGAATYFDYTIEQSLGETFNDRVFGGTESDVIFGEMGDDIVFGESGNDKLYGDRHTHEIEWVYSTNSNVGQLRKGFVELPGELHGQDSLFGGTGDDRLQGNGGDDLLDGGADNDTIFGDDYALAGEYHGNDQLDGGSGIDTLYGDGGHDRLDGGEGNDTLFGDSDIFSFWNGATYDRFELAPEFEGNDVLDGGAGDDDLRGQGGDDRLTGGSGSDKLRGGAGNDTYLFKPGDSSRNFQDHLWDEEGSNILVFDSLMSHEQLHLYANDGDSLLVTSSGNEILLYGQTASHIDYIQVADGGRIELDDILIVEDTFQGSSDDDQYYVDSSQDKIVEAAGGGIDWVVASVSYTLPDNVENLRMADGWSLVGKGNKEKNTIVGNSSNNVLIGGDYDTLIGGKGNDTYIDIWKDVIVEKAGEGIDTVRVNGGGRFKAADYIEIIDLQNKPGGNGGSWVEGNDQDNTILGNYYYGNRLVGGGGNDFLDNRYSVFAILDGGEGADTVVSRYGEDIIYVDNKADVIQIPTTKLNPEIPTGNVTRNATYNYSTASYAKRYYDSALKYYNAGNLIYSSVDYKLGAGLESIVLIKSGLTGAGNDNDNLLAVLEDVQSGTLVGGKGNDFYEILGQGEFTIVEKENEGIDTVFLRNSLTFDLRQNPNVEYVVGGVKVYGDDLNNNISRARWVSAGKGDDTIELTPGGTAVYNRGDGFDTISFSSTPYAPSLHHFLEFGEGISLSDLEVRLDNGHVQYLIRGSNGNGVQGNGISQVRFADGLTLDAWQVFDYLGCEDETPVLATEGNDHIAWEFASGAGSKPIVKGLDGNDEIESGSFYTVDGGKGDDILFSSQGFVALGETPRRYRFNEGDGHDIIRSIIGQEMLEFRGSLVLDDLRITQSDNGDTILSLGDDQTITLEKSASRLADFYLQFGRHSEYRLDDLVSAMQSGKLADLPSVMQPVEPILVTDLASFTHEIPKDAFKLNGSSTNMGVTLEDGSPLPEWLVFDGRALRIKEDLYDYDTNWLSMRVNVSDGNGLAVSTTVSLMLAHFDSAPVVLDTSDWDVPLDSTVWSKRENSFGLGEQFYNRDASYGDYLRYAATMADGSSLPGWIQVSDDGLLRVNAPNEVGDSFTLKVMATDSTGKQATALRTFDVLPNEITSSFSLRFANGAGGNLYGGSYQDYLRGSNVIDKLYARAGDDYLDGRQGNDTLYGEAGHDILVGGSGNDQLIGGDGNDTYQIRLGDGIDKIVESTLAERSSSGDDTITFGSGIALDQLRFEDKNQTDIKESLYIGGSQRIDFSRKDAVEWFEFSNGDRWSKGTLIDHLTELERLNNRAPTVTSHYGDMTVSRGKVYNLELASHFDDPEGRLMTFSVTRADGSALPDWLRFTAETGELTLGAVPMDATGCNLLVTAKDRFGAIASQNFGLIIKPENHAPVAVKDQLTMAKDKKLFIPITALLANDIDPDGNALQLLKIENIKNGSATITTVNGTRGVLFTPKAGFIGTASFDYLISDGELSAKAQSSLTVEAIKKSFSYSLTKGNYTISQAGAGQSVLTINSAIAESRLSYWQKGSDLIVRVDNKESTQVTVQNHFQGGNYGMETIIVAGKGHLVEHLDIQSLNNSLAGMVSAMASFNAIGADAGIKSGDQPGIDPNSLQLASSW